MKVKNNRNFWKNKRVLVTGGHGFLGSHLIDKLSLERCDLISPKSSDYDLTKEEHVKKMFEKNRNIDIVIHLAADGGGIGYMKNNPGNIFYNNIMMSALVQEYSRRNSVKKFVGIGSVCEYPKFAAIPFVEEDLWEGYPEETNAPYGLAKKMMLVQSQAYRDQYEFNSIHLMPVNLYGPRDNFDVENGHVIPSLIKKMVVAKRENLPFVEIWGSGNVSREFIYVEDCADAIIIASERYNKRDPINIGSGEEITIRDLATKIKKIIGFEGELVYNKNKPDGQPRRCLDTSKAKKEFGFKAKIGLEEGLKKTIEWYINLK